MSEPIGLIWKFIRDDMPVSVFEQWIYKTPELENLLGSTLYFEVIACNYKEPDSVWTIKQVLKAAVDQIEPRKCQCLSWRDSQKVPISYDTGWEKISEDFIILRRRSPWLDLCRCKFCDQEWYVAVDTVDDDYYLYRLKTDDVTRIISNNEWPSVFDNFAVVWPDEEWLLQNGYKSLTDWQERNNDGGVIKSGQ
jgi:hypothetical protein